MRGFPLLPGPHKMETGAENHFLAWALEGSAGALLLVPGAGVLFPLRGRREAEPDPLEDSTPRQSRFI